MKERPILFSAPMVRAILAGTKTQTRRILRDQQPVDLGACTNGVHLSKRPVHDNGKMVGHRMAIVCCPYGQPGDRLWVRETWAVDGPLDQAKREHEDFMPGFGHGPYFRADPVHENTGLTWRPSIFMPRWASRITLEVTGVRVERLQEISADDALAEGIVDFRPLIESECKSGETADECARRLRWPQREYELLWNSINAKRAPWSSNPFVWVVEFAYLKGDEG